MGTAILVNHVITTVLVMSHDHLHLGDIIKQSGGKVSPWLGQLHHNVAHRDDMMSHAICASHGLNIHSHLATASQF